MNGAIQGVEAFLYKSKERLSVAVSHSNIKKTKKKKKNLETKWEKKRL